MTLELQVFDVRADQLHLFDLEGHYSVQFETFKLDMYFRPSDARQGFVFSPGFLDRGKFPVPYFQRIKWFDDLEGVGISLSDPTLNLHDDLRIGWFIGTQRDHYLREVGVFLGQLLAHLGIPPERTLFFGSSAGGFTSLGFAALLPGSQAFAVNPQTNVLRFHSIRDLGTIIQTSFRGMNVIGLEQRYQDRFDLIALFREAGHVPPFLIWQNIFDLYHYERHLMPFLSELPALKPSQPSRVEIAAMKEVGHNPPPLSVLKRYFDDIVSSWASTEP
jgi:pimeloyl-ACP methyl ester carboxylesterase